jgi:hypothetical protein
MINGAIDKRGDKEAAEHSNDLLQRSFSKTIWWDLVDFALFQRAGGKVVGSDYDQWSHM